MNKTNGLAGFIILCFVCLTTYSAPVQNEPYQFRQPDGTLVNVIVNGDEFYQDVETPDGFSLIRDPATDWICFAKLSDDGTEFLSTGVVYTGAFGLPKKQSLSGIQKHLRITTESVLKKRNAKYKELNGESYGTALKKFLSAATPAAPATTIDTVYGLTILVDFPDQASQVPRDSIVNWLNMAGYTGYKNNGSVRDFYSDMAVGKLVYLQQISNFIRAKNNKTSYDQGTGYGGSTTLINEICATFKAQGGVDFSKVTKNNGIIQVTNILYAGSPTAGWANGLWPHSGTLNFTFATGAQMSSHMLSNIGTTVTLGTICHENGHMLCKYPDLYAYDGHSNGAGNYDIMSGSGSSTNPPPFSAFLRSLRGWMQVTDISSDQLGKLYKVPVNSDVAYIYSGATKGSTQELFCMEARRKTGRSATLPDSGLLIWHIDKAGNNTSTGKNDYAVPEQADGKLDIENKKNMGNVGDLWRANNKVRFNDTTVPSALWHNNAKSGIQIANVSNVKDTMTFSLGNTVSGAIEFVSNKEPGAAFMLTVGQSGIRYSIPLECAGARPWVTMHLFGLNGQLIATPVNGPQAAATEHIVHFDRISRIGKSLPKGAYFCKVSAGAAQKNVQVFVQ